MGKEFLLLPLTEKIDFSADKGFKKILVTGEI